MKKANWMKTNIRVIHLHNKRRQLPRFEFLPYTASFLDFLVCLLFCLIIWASKTQEPYGLETSGVHRLELLSRINSIVWRMIVRIRTNHGFLGIFESVKVNDRAERVSSNYAISIIYLGFHLSKWWAFNFIVLIFYPPYYTVIIDFYCNISWHYILRTMLRNNYF